MKSFNLQFTLSALFCLSFCSAGNDDITYEIIDGVEVRIYGDNYVVPENPYTVEERVVFGADQGLDTYIMAGARPAELGPDGTLYVVDIRQMTVFRFAKDGTYLGQFGQKGGGPGEFLSIGTIVADEDVLNIVDSSKRAIIRTDLEGGFISQHKLDPSVPNTLALYGPRNARHIISWRITPKLPLSEVFTVSRWDELYQHIDSPISYELIGTKVIVSGMLHSYSYSNKEPACGWRTDMPFAWYSGDQFRIDFLDPEDLSRWAAITPLEAHATNSTMKEQYLQRFFARNGLVNEARRTINFPKHLPQIRHLHWDTSGRLWAQEYNDPELEEREFWFQVFSAKGEWLFRQQLQTTNSFMPYWCIITGDGYYNPSRLDDGTPVIIYYEFVKKDPDFDAPVHRIVHR